MTALPSTAADSMLTETAGRSDPGLPEARPAARRRVRSRMPGLLGRVVLAAFTPVLALLAAWWIFIWLVNTSPLVAQSPVDVLRELTTGSDAADLRSTLVRGLFTTFDHAALGLVTGLVAGCLLAAAAGISTLGAALIRPTAVGLRSVPVIAFAPLLTLVFDRGLLVVSIIGGIVTVVPTLYYLLEGLRSVPPQLVDVIRAGGGRTVSVLWLAQAPTAVPALALALRVAAPGALVGALLAEWLATGDGLGAVMVRGQASFDYGSVWAATFLVTITGMALYGSCLLIERAALRRWAPNRRNRNPA